jgi:hypothetical protein
MDQSPPATTGPKSARVPKRELMRDDSSLASSAIQYPEENGRRYHAYRPGRYNFPNDEVSSKFRDSVYDRRTDTMIFCQRELERLGIPLH